MSTFFLGSTSFKLLQSFDDLRLEEKGDFFVVAKTPKEFTRLNAILAPHQIRTMFEIGILYGGSTAYFAEHLNPDRIVATDNEAPVQQLEDWIEQTGRRDRVRTYYGVDQSDCARMQQIYSENFGSTKIDMIIDDASHELECTRASFNLLFPQLRAGGIYIIEDWACSDVARGYEEILGGHLIGRPPLSLLVKDIVLASALGHGLIDEVIIDESCAVVRRGDKAMPDDFDVRTFT